MSRKKIEPFARFDDVHQVAVTDRVLGGDLGAVNIQAQELANRDEFMVNTHAEDWDLDPDNSPTNSLLATNGYQKLPSGLILQWGKTAAPTRKTIIQFHRAFDTALFNVTAVACATKDRDFARDVEVSYTNLNDANKTNITVVGDSAPGEIMWFAIGY